MALIDNSRAKSSVKSRAGIFRLVVIVFVLCHAAFLSAQSQQRAVSERQRTPVYRVQSNLVIIDVVVRDRRGNLIEDLKREDFRILEDNIAQEIVTFSLEKIPMGPDPAVVRTLAEGAVPAGAPAAPPAPVINLQSIPVAQQKKEDLKEKRLVILFFDLSSLQTEELIRSVEAARDFVEKRSTPHDLIAIATYSSILELVQDLTNDKTVLLKTLKMLNPLEAGETSEEFSEEEPSEDVYIPDAVQFNIFNTDRRLTALETVAKMYRDIAERKSLIYFSSGMSTTGVENYSQIRSTVDVANQSNMSIYTVDSRGLQALPPGGDASRGAARGRAMFSGSGVRNQMASFSASRETLTTLAIDTGGEIFQDTNDLAPVFSKVLNDTQTYYILGYYSSNTKEDGKFRKVKIEVARPDLKLQHRPGYFASKQFTSLTQNERDRQLEEAMNVDFPFSDVPFILQADYFKTESSARLVPLSIQLAGDGVKFEEKGNSREAGFEFLAQVVEPKGRVAGVARDTVQVRLPAQTAQKIQGGQIIYTTGFQLRPGEYKLKFLVRDNRTGKIGSFEQNLAVPSMEGPGLDTSSVILGGRLVDTKDNTGAVAHRGIGKRFEALGIKFDPLVIGDKRIIPSIGHVFTSRQNLYVYFHVYGAAAEAATAKPSVEVSMLVLQDRTKIFETQRYVVNEWAKEPKDVVPVTLAMPLSKLKKGTYTLQLHIHDGVSDTNLFRRLPFVVE